MIARKKSAGLLTIAAVTALAGVASANSLPVVFNTVAGSDSDGPLSATVSFQAINGGLQITVTNNENGTIAKGQAISDLSFGVSGISTPSAFTELDGLSFNPVSGGSWTLASGTALSGNNTSSAPPVNSIDHWGFSNSSGILLATADSPVPGAGNPQYMILASNGTAGPGNSLSNSNFDPYIIGPTVFTLTVANMTANTTLSASNFSNVMVSFGTGPDKSLGTTASPPTAPLPAAFWSGLSLISALTIGSGVRKKLAH